MRFLKLYLLLFLAMWSHSCFALTDLKKDSLSSKSPVYITADELSYSRSTSIARATGSVEIEQDNQIIFADEVMYDKASDIIYAKGNVTILRDDGSVFFTDETVLGNSISKGIAINFKARMGEKSLLAARNAEILDSNTIRLADLTYSPCKICENNLFKNTPLWQFKSKQAVISTTDESITYKHATLEAFGVPIAYSPYLKTPSPGAKRKSGFLIPRIIQSSQQLGLGVKIPYYVNISKNMDATITPMFVSKASDLYSAQFRHLTNYGKYKIDAGITNNQNSRSITGSNNVTRDPFEAYYDISGEFDFNSFNNTKSRIFIDSRRIFDKAKTFLKKYKLSDDQILNTDISYNLYKNNDWYSMRILSFQDLRPIHNNKTTAAALPIIDIHKEWDTGINKIKAIAKFNYLNLSRPQGVNYHRGISKLELHRRFNLAYGQTLKINGSVRADAYQVDIKPIIVTDTLTTNAGVKEGYESRIHPELNTEWSLPFINTEIPNTTIILEPVVNVILSPYSPNLDKGVNEDSQIPEISASTLFEPNRYKGFDKIESATRMNYGLRGNISSEHFKNLYFILGHNIRSKPDPNFTKKTGLNGYRSDIVSKVSLQPIDNIYINNNSRVSDEDLSLQRNELNIDASFKKVNFHLSHFYISKDLLSSSTPKFRQELVSGAAYNFYDKFWAEGEFSTRLGKRPQNQTSNRIYDKAALRYNGDCFYFRLAVTRDHTTLIDLKPETSYTITFNIPTF